MIAWALAVVATSSPAAEWIALHASVRDALQYVEAFHPDAEDMKDVEIATETLFAAGRRVQIAVVLKESIASMLMPPCKFPAKFK